MIDVLMNDEEGVEYGKRWWSSPFCDICLRRPSEWAGLAPLFSYLRTLAVYRLFLCLILRQTRYTNLSCFLFIDDFLD
jgi:hypothetical protein